MNRLLLLVFAVLLAACTQPENAKVQVLIGGTLVDGKGGEIENSVIIVEDGKIRAVGSQTHTPIPAGSKKISTTSYTIRPVPPGVLAPGEPASLELVTASGLTARKMQNGQWQ